MELLNHVQEIIEVPAVLKKRIAEVLQKYQYGLALLGLGLKYEERFGEELPFAKYGFGSTELMMTSLIGDLVTIHYTASNEAVVKLLPHAADKYAPALHSKTEVRAKPISSDKDKTVKTMPRKITDRKPPSDSVLPGETIPLEEVKIGVKLGFCTVRVSQVTDGPNCFYLQLVGPKTTTALDDVMNSLEKDYACTDGMQYAVLEEHVVKGLTCACLFEDNNWHRAKILSDNNSTSQQIKVFYVDYGTVATINKKDIRYLKKCFLDFPAQGLECRLAGIRPKLNERKWSQQAMEKFYRSTVNGDLMGMFLNERQHPVTKDHVFLVCLCDINHPDGELHINDMLVNEGHAEYHNDDQESQQGTPVVPQTNSTTPDTSWLQTMCFPWMSNPILAPFLAASYSVAATQAAMVAEMAKQTHFPTLPFNLNDPLLYRNAMPSDKTNIFACSQESSLTKPEKDYKRSSPMKLTPPEPIFKLSNSNSESSTNSELVKIDSVNNNESIILSSNDYSRLTTSDLSLNEDPMEHLTHKLDSIPSLKKRSVKFVQLTPTQHAHLILYNKTLCIIREEISAFFWKKDMLANMLRIHSLRVPSITISEKVASDVFQELIRYHVHNAETDKACMETIYTLANVIYIIEKLKPEAEELLTALKQEQDNFSLYDSYWGLECDDDSSLSCDLFSGDEFEFSLQVLGNRKHLIEEELEMEHNRYLEEELHLINEQLSAVVKLHKDF